MVIKPEQKQAVAAWIAGGDSLSVVQRKLSEQFQIAMTYMDVRFLVDDLNLEIRDPLPPQDKKTEEQTPAAAEKKGFLDKMKEKVGLGSSEEESEELEEAEDEELPPDSDELPADGLVGVTLTVDKINLIPGALASGTVTFSDGVTGKWIVDQYGRPGFTEISKQGYRPTAADAQDFMQQLSATLQNQGF